MDIYTDIDMVKELLTNRILLTMNNSKLPNRLGESMIMGALIMLTSVGIITIMNAF